jgi:hypothetical protein
VRVRYSSGVGVGVGVGVGADMKCFFFYRYGLRIGKDHCNDKETKGKDSKA